MTRKIKLFSIVISVFGILSMYAQKEPVLFSVAGSKVNLDEFQRVYEKNLSIVNDDDQRDLANYLDLYINYKLKLKEAFDLKMDTIASYKREYNKYKNQLLVPYLKDENTEKDLVKEAYERLQKEVNASHILVRVDKNATPKDTLRAFTKINKARERVLNGEDFSKVAKEMSEDPSAKKNGGKLGYFTAFQMVYPFETAAYTTPVGTVSKPFKTRFGYHIVQVNDLRKAQGEVEVAHIMLKGVTPKNEAKIKTIKKELDKGANFENLAKQYSQDGGSAKKGGKLPKFGGGRMVKEFEDIAFSLQKEGDISVPFKTAYGWHIVKLIKKYPLASFDEMQESLKKRVAQGNRAKIIGKSIEKRLLKEYGYTVNNTLYTAFQKPDWNNNTDLQSTIPFLRIQDTLIPVSEFYHFYQKKARNNSLDKVLTEFKGEKSVAYYKEHLADRIPELGYTLKEYQEGLLLFDLMQQRIWEKAEKDSLGLKHFFETHQNNYQWGERVKAKIITCNTKEIADKAYGLLQQNTAFNSLEQLLPKESLIATKEGVFEKKDAVFPKDFVFTNRLSKPIKTGEQFVVIRIEGTVPPQHKILEETRGKVISDYQDFLEKEWIKKLKKRYPVQINQSNFEKLSKSYQD